jgi:hypothetical protein
MRRSDWHDASWVLIRGRLLVSTGQITVWTSDPSPSPIEVLVDGVVVGQLTAYRKARPVCGAHSAGAVSVTRAEGTYVLSAREIAGPGCWEPADVAVVRGRCCTIELGP